MSYEYSAASARFEIDNPYKVENVALLVCGVLGALAGLFLLIGFRDAMGNPSLRGVRGIVIGLLLLAGSLAVIGRATMQLRYFFGRGRPHDLTNLDAGSGAVPPRRDEWLKENLRQNALAYREPQGAISGLVHQVFKTLIFAPRLIRAAAEAQCFNALLTLAILLGLLAIVALDSDPAVESWLAVIYLGALLPKLVRPFGSAESYARARAGIGFIAFIVAVPILGPPLLGRLVGTLPDIAELDLPQRLGTCLFVLLVAQSLFFLTLMRQLRDRPAVNMACVTRSLSMNSNPAKLFEELERTLQSRWTETIPNRRYALVKLPDVLSGQSGSFAGEVLEETQPLPTSGGPTTSVLEKLRDTANLPINALTALGALSYIGATLQPGQLRPRPRRPARLVDGAARHHVLLHGLLLPAQRPPAAGPRGLSVGAGVGRDQRQLRRGAHQHRQSAHHGDEQQQEDHQRGIHDAARVGRRARHGDPAEGRAARSHRHARPHRCRGVLRQSPGTLCRTAGVGGCTRQHRR